jgi:hypothetical protein
MIMPLVVGRWRILTTGSTFSSKINIKPNSCEGEGCKVRRVFIIDEYPKMNPWWLMCELPGFD